MLTGMNKPAEQPELGDGAVELLTQLRACGPMTRSEIGAATGWARPTVNRRIEELESIDIVRPLSMPSPTGGRPAQGFTFDASCAVVLAIDIATTATTIALCDLDGAPTAIRTVEAGAEDEPEHALDLIEAAADALLDGTADDDTDGEHDTGGPP